MLKNSEQRFTTTQIYLKKSGQFRNEKTENSYYHDFISPAYSRVKALCYEILNLNQQAIIRKTTEAKETAQKAGLYMILISLTALVISVLVMLKNTFLVIKPIKELTLSVNQIAEKKIFTAS